MGWREEQRRVAHPNGMAVGASFRGVPFRTTDSDTGVGRRNEVHEYPMRDLPYADDLGRRAREFQVNGYVVGRTTSRSGMRSSRRSKRMGRVS